MCLGSGGGGRVWYLGKGGLTTSCASSVFFSVASCACDSCGSGVVLRMALTRGAASSHLALGTMKHVDGESFSVAMTAGTESQRVTPKKQPRPLKNPFICVNISSVD